MGKGELDGARSARGIELRCLLPQHTAALFLGLLTDSKPESSCSSRLSVTLCDELRRETKLQPEVWESESVVVDKHANSLAQIKVYSASSSRYRFQSDNPEANEHGRGQWRAATGVKNVYLRGNVSARFGVEPAAFKFHLKRRPSC